MAIERRGRHGWLSTVTNQYYPTEQAANEAETAFKQSGPGKTIDTLTQQILGQGLTDKWSGQGHGSAEANARDMARIMADAGITDIKQFGQIERPVTINQTVTPEFSQGGEPTGRFINPATGQYAENVQWVSDGVDGMIPVTPVQSTEKVFGNKETGQTFAQTYASDPTAWGGTYAGKGNTGYRVHFTDDGTPYFYTTGASSSDLGSIAPLLAIAQFVPGPVGIAARIANAGIAIDQGNTLGGLASLTGIPGVSDFANTAGLGSVVSGIQTANQVNNIVNAAESGNVLGALNAGANLTGTGGVQIGDTGFKVSDVLRTANIANDLDKGNFGSLISTLAPRGGVSGPKSSDFEEGYFRPGGAGYDDPDNIDAGGGWNPANVMPQTSGPTSVMPENPAPANLFDFPPQDLGITPENWESYQKNLLTMQEEGRLPTQWIPDDSGNFTYRSDDGSSITIDPSGNVLSSTKAPAGNLLTDIVPPSKPPAAPPASNTPSPSTAPKTPGAAQPDGGMDMLSMLGLMGMMGGFGQQSQPQPVQTPLADVKSFEEQGYGDIFGPKLQFSGGGDVNDLLQLLRG